MSGNLDGTPVDSRGKDSPVEDYLNDKFQTLSDLENLDALLTIVQTQQSQLRDQLQEAETRADKARNAAKEHSQNVLIQAQLFRQEQEDIDRRLRATTSSETAQDAAREFETSMEKLRRLDVAKGYIALIIEVNKLSEEARKLIQKDPKSALVPYNKLQHLAKSLKIRHEASESAAVHLVDFVEKTTSTLWDEMKDKLAGEFQNVLGKMGWPAPKVDLNKFPEFQKGFDKLLVLQEPEIQSGLKDKPLLPLEVLVKPLELRFRYHFEGDKQTNRVDKPEWFLSQLITLITTYNPFLCSYIQPILSSSENPHVSSRDAVNEFITALLPVLRRKIHNLLPQILDQAQLLSHFIHEMIKFDAVLRDEFSYVPYGENGWKGVTHEVLTVENGFAGWIKVEKEFALSRYHNILKAEDAWVIDYDSAGPNDAKPTKSALRLKDLLETITDRYRPLTSFNQRLSFLMNIQISILDQYLNRLQSSIDAFSILSSSIARAVQGTSKEEVQSLSGIGGLERLCKVYGSATFLEDCTRDWDEDPFFLELWEELQTRAQKSQQSNSNKSLTGTMNVEEIANVTSNAVVSGDDDGALFDNIAEAYKSLRTRAEEMIVELLLGSIKEELKSYSRITLWSSIDMDRGDSTISPEIVPAVATLNSFLDFLAKTVAAAVFRRVFRKLGAGIQNWMWDYVITRNQFSSAGGSQFSSDINEIWKTCSRYVEEPTASMRKLKDSCVLLTLPTSPAEGSLGLKEVAGSVFQGGDKARDTLGRLGLANLSANDARTVLQRRVEAFA
ncbi:uncharacterized protein H6S33_000157 [Morchella sextelata]|uniref:uncharacterized protein n=1 Tax=Morchella sextelata TaxID=1174677 RepID=UPI001D051189|nr:uncharacterized protein H6S33_000157 [Morchella sextelata]KAH0614521.1 hypothetical protein H6S33_000157 [Morchella sextelata]